jgi:hypothetical protein
MPIDKLPDDVILAIFYFCIVEQSIKQSITKKEVESWQILVHVCRQWRRVVFRSPRRLNLRLYCAIRTRRPLRDTLDDWPALPLLIQDAVNSTEELDNTIAVLEHSDRVQHIGLADFSSYLENILAAMQKPFPELTYLWLFSIKGATVIPDSFLGGSAPRLRELTLHGIPFPGLPKLLLSATHLTNLTLSIIPHSGYFSPKGIITALSTLTTLRRLLLEFESPQSLPDGESRHPPPPTRSVFPTLTILKFKGVGEYLEDLVALIDAPQLCFLSITLFNQIFFDTPQSIQFLSRTPALQALKKACLVFKKDAAAVVLSSPTNGTGYEEVEVEILCRESDWQVSSLEQACTSCLPPLSALEDLYIYEDSKSPPDWRDNIESALWLELFHSFSAVKNFYLSEKFALRIAPALQELVGTRTMEVLPTLQNMFVEGLQPSGPVQEGIVKFVAARELSGHPITISLWERDGV